MFRLFYNQSCAHTPGKLPNSLAATEFGGLGRRTQ